MPGPKLHSSTPSPHSTSSMPICSAMTLMVVVFPAPAGPVRRSTRWENKSGADG
jgi:hypothetical protein